MTKHTRNWLHPRRRIAPSYGRILLIGAIAATVLNAAAVSAQEAVVEEIIVTATKRGNVSVQDIAGGIRAVSGETIDDYLLYNLVDLARLEPSLQVATQGIADSQLVIRGIQSPGAATVGQYFDEAVITPANFQDGGGRAPNIAAFDIERVEILKGPQGTLFGASSMSGTVRYVSRKPDPSGFDANVSLLGAGTDDGNSSYNVNAMVNIPLAEDVFALRLVGWTGERGGYIDYFAGLDGVNVLNDVNDAEITGGRIAARWNASESFTLDVFALGQNTEIGGGESFYDVSSGILEPIFVFAGPDAGMTLPGRGGEFGDLKVTKPAQEPWEDDTTLFGATGNWDTGPGTWTGTVSYFERETFHPFDTTPTAVSFGFPLGDFSIPGAGGPFGGYVGHQDQEREILSGELRFSSLFEGPVNFVTGLYYQDESTFSELAILVVDPVTGLPPCQNHAECLANPALATQALAFARTQNIDLEFFALFGHVDWEINERWTIGAGLRYFDSEQHNLEFLTQAFPGSEGNFALPPILGGPIQTVPIPTIDSKVEEDETTFDFNIGFQATESQLYYFRAASGFRPGGLNDTALASLVGVVAPATFEPDTVISYEVGGKTSWLAERLTLNAAVFYMVWDDIQVQGQEPTGAFEFIDNATDADITGIEFELFARPTDRWYLSFGLTLLDTELTKDQTSQVPGGNKGDPIPKVPESAFSGNIEYTLPINANFDTVFRAFYSYTGESDTFFNSDFPGFAEIGDYFLLDLSASLRWSNWEAKLFVENVTDERAVVDIDFGPDGRDVFTVRPITYGAQLTWRFE